MPDDLPCALNEGGAPLEREWDGPRSRGGGVVEEGEERIVEVSVRAANDLGDHAKGTVVVSMPHAS